MIVSVILAGGKSSRMGSDKATLEINGQTFIEKIVKELSEIKDNEIIISGEGRNLPYRNILDIYKDLGPLGGMYSVLEKTNSEVYIFIAVDTPLIERNDIENLLKNLKEHSAIHYENSFLPLVINRKNIDTKTLEELKYGGSIKGFLNKIDTMTIPLDNIEKLKNINTLDDYKEIKELI